MPGTGLQGGVGGATGFVGGRVSDEGPLRPREVKKDKRKDKAEKEEVVVGCQRNCTARCRRGL